MLTCRWLQTPGVMPLVGYARPLSPRLHGTQSATRTMKLFVADERRSPLRSLLLAAAMGAWRNPSIYAATSACPSRTIVFSLGSLLDMFLDG